MWEIIMNKKARFESFLSDLEKKGADTEMMEKIRNGFNIITEAEIEPEVEAEDESEPAIEPEPAVDETEIEPEIDSGAEVIPASEFDGLKTLAIKLLYDAQQFHIWHLNCGLIAEHMALQDVYEFLVDFSDDIAEAIIGIEDKIIDSSTTTFTIDAFAYDKGIAIGKLVSIKEMMQASLDSTNEEDGIINIIADGIQHIDKFIYKLKRFE